MAIGFLRRTGAWLSGGAYRARIRTLERDVAAATQRIAEQDLRLTGLEARLAWEVDSNRKIHATLLARWESRSDA